MFTFLCLKQRERNKRMSWVWRDIREAAVYPLYTLKSGSTRDCLDACQTRLPVRAEKLGALSLVSTFFNARFHENYYFTLSGTWGFRIFACPAFLSSI